uniref:Cilia and flagella associated protein 58 n=1 Tax=Cyprinodon variegatus TaxID=28743 RepID=A0A3Q2CVU7_CYPVA
PTGEESVGKDSSESVEDFQVVLSGLADDESSNRIRLEYEKLLHALEKSKDNEHRLMSKCRELNAEILSTSNKMAAALKLSEEDEATIASLKKELDEAWKMVDAAHDKEKKDMETIRSLKEDVSKLTDAADGPAVCLDLIQMIEETTKERDQLMTTVEDLREKLKKATETQQEVETQREDAAQKISKLQQELQVQHNKISREIRLKEKLDKEVQQLHADMEAKEAEIKAVNMQGQKAREEQQRLEKQLKDLKVLHERCTKELEQIQVRNTKLQQECGHLSSAKEQLSMENHQRENELKVKEEELAQIRQEVAKQIKMRLAVQKKIHQMEDQKAELDVQTETLKAQIAALEKELESSTKQVEIDKKAKEELIRERDTLHKNMTKALHSAEKQQNLLKLLEQDKRTLENEISGYRQEAQKQRKIIQQLEKERDRYVNESSGLMQKVQQKITAVEGKEMEIFDLRKKVTESEAKVKQQENQLESVVTERNLYSRNLIECQITEMKRKLKTMNNHTARLKEEIIGKEQALVRDQQEQKRLEKDSEALKVPLQAGSPGGAGEGFCFSSILLSLRTQKYRVTRERDSLSKQLLQSNDERAQLFEKIKIQQSILSKGEFHYNQRLEEIHQLKLEIKKLRRKRNILDRTLPNTEELRTELVHLQEELLRERTRNRVLEDQQRPINIHRWRQLEGNDPGKYQLIQKIHALQKRLIVKTQEVEERELLLQEKEKLYEELKQILARQPGPEAAEQLQRCRWTIRERTKKLQAVMGNVKMLDSKLDEYKSENERLSSELANVKKKYLSQKRLHR